MARPEDHPLTTTAREIVDRTLQRAAERGLASVDDVSLDPVALWTLIRWERKVGLVTLVTMGVDLACLAEDLDVLITRPSEESTSGDRDGLGPFRESGERLDLENRTAIASLIARSATEARRLGHDYVGSEHLLLAIVTGADARLVPVLQRRQVTYDRTRSTVLELLGG